MSIQQYLERYAEPEAAELSPLVKARYKHVVIIPAKDEPVAFIKRLERFISDRPNTLAIVVLNQSDTTPSQENQNLWHYVTSKAEQLSHKLVLLKANESTLAVINRFEKPLPEKQGVGLARKIGADITLALYANKQIERPWLHCTDADVELPPNYFDIKSQSKKLAACIYPYQHSLNENIQAIKLYELRLAYYANGLKWAGSPYGYQTVGSTLVINAEHYAKVRGFPKLSAGEDFHILNKLAKTGQILPLEQPVLSISNRISYRVPFGTGQSVAKIQTSESPLNLPLFENPVAFTYLKTVLQGFDSFWVLGDAEKVIASFNHTPIIQEALQHCQFTKGLQHAFKQSKNVEQFKKQLQQHFDALASLRFIHCIDAQHGQLNYQQLREQQPEWIKNVNL